MIVQCRRMPIFDQILKHHPVYALIWYEIKKLQGKHLKYNKIFTFSWINFKT